MHGAIRQVPKSKEHWLANLVPDGGQQAMQLSLLEPISGNWQQSDKAGVHQQALGNLPGGTHAHHVVQEHLREGAAWEGSRLQMQASGLAHPHPTARPAGLADRGNILWALTSADEVRTTSRLFWRAEVVSRTCGSALRSQMSAALIRDALSGGDGLLQAGCQRRIARMLTLWQGMNI